MPRNQKAFCFKNKIEKKHWSSHLWLALSMNKSDSCSWKTKNISSMLKSGQVRSGQVRSGQVRSGQVRLLAFQSYTCLAIVPVFPVKYWRQPGGPDRYSEPQAY
jgi:hypothetical protein